MRRFSLLITLAIPFVLAALVWAALPPPTAHAQGNATATILADRLNVRSGPGTGYGVVSGVKAGEKYGVVGQNANCAWLQIAKGGKTLGWVSGNKAYVKLTGACSSIPAAGAGSAAAPASPKGKQGCALLISRLAMDVTLNVKRADGWNTAWSIPAGGQVKACVDPGSYTATFTAAGMPGNMAFPLTVKGGEYYEIPLALPGN